jgi:hypothetical protein
MITDADICQFHSDHQASLESHLHTNDLLNISIAIFFSVLCIQYYQVYIQVGTKVAPVSKEVN